MINQLIKYSDSSTCEPVGEPNVEYCTNIIDQASKSSNVTDELLKQIYECVKKPWAAVIWIENPDVASNEQKNICFGNIISKNYILTSADCICNEYVPGANCVWNDGVKSDELLPNGQPAYLPGSQVSRVDYNFHEFVQIVLPGNLRDFRLNNIRMLELCEERSKTYRTQAVTIHPEYVRPSRPQANLCLIKLEKNIDFEPGHVSPICLPGPDTNDLDVKAKIAGWGNLYATFKEKIKYRSDCTTSSEGPEVFKRCRNSFILQGDYMEQCVNLVPPSESNEHCKELHTAVPETQAHHAVLHLDEQQKITCFPSNFTQYGWCATCVHGAKHGEPGRCGSSEQKHLDDESYSSVGYDAGWGYCQKHCYENAEDPDEHYIEEVDVAVLSKQECLDHSLEISYASRVDRELCVRKRKFRTTSIYNVNGSGFTKFGDEIENIDGGPETCQGDPGGSLYSLDVERKPVLLGVANTVRNCSDKSATAIYTRVKHYLGWIESVMEN